MDEPNDLDRVLSELTDRSRRLAFSDLPEMLSVLYAVWVDYTGAVELSNIAPAPVPAGILYVGESVTQGSCRHPSHNQIGSLTLMKNLAALFRTTWHLEADLRGARLAEPGLGRLRSWMSDHLTATVSPRGRTETKVVLSALDPCLRIEGWAPERTELRQRLTNQRAELNRRR